MRKGYSDLSRSGKYLYEKRLSRTGENSSRTPGHSDIPAEPSSPKKARSNESSPDNRNESDDNSESDNNNGDSMSDNNSSGSEDHGKDSGEESEGVSSENDVLEYDMWHDNDMEYHDDEIDDLEDDNDNFAGRRNVARDQPLYAGAPLSVDDSMLLIMNLMLKHNLTASSVSDILSVIEMHCIEEQRYKGFSLYHFKKYFSLPDGQFIKEFYCSNCLGSLKSENEVCTQCTVIGRRPKNSYFLRVPLIPQLQTLFSKKGFHELLQKRFHREGGDQIISDVYDGSLYKTHATGVLSDPNSLSLMLYTDGVPVFKSGTSMWPFSLKIQELPVKERNKQENTLLAGLWFGPHKANVNTVLGSFQEELRALARGVKFRVSDLQESIKVKTIILTAIGDLPTKSDLMNTVKYNGFNGCIDCELPGETVSLDSGGHVHVYRYEPCLVLRDRETTIQYGREAHLQGAPVQGVKGPTMLSKIMPDFVKGMGIDPMHGIHGGVVKKLIHLWFDSEYSGCQFSLLLMIPVIDQRLLSIKPPKLIHRMPKSVTDLCHWKASELKSWLFYYALPVLSGIMLPVYFKHFELLVTAAALLHGDCITVTDIETAKALLDLFVRDYETLYGLRHCTINVHQLLHVAVKTEVIGPLWVPSCFSFEDLNGKMLSKVHGTTHLDSQVVNSHLMLQSFSVKISETPDGVVKDFLTGCKQQVKIAEKIEEHSYAVGCYKKFESRGILGPAAERIKVANSTLWKYHRLLKNDVVYVAESYGTNLQTESSFVVYKDNGTCYGNILTFLKVSVDCNCRKMCVCEGTHYALTQKMTQVSDWVVDGPPIAKIPHLIKCHPSHMIVPVKVCDVKCVCFLLDIGSNFVLARPVNLVEVE